MCYVSKITNKTRICNVRISKLNIFWWKMHSHSASLSNCLFWRVLYLNWGYFRLLYLQVMCHVSVLMCDDWHISVLHVRYRWSALFVQPQERRIAKSHHADACIIGLAHPLDVCARLNRTLAFVRYVTRTVGYIYNAYAFHEYAYKWVYRALLSLIVILGISS